MDPRRARLPRLWTSTTTRTRPPPSRVGIGAHIIESSRASGATCSSVPRDLVLAAHPVCDSLEYTSDANCNPGKSLADGQVEVTSSAARYNPAFYFVIGTAARPFDGDAALYAMRAAAAVMCALMIALAAATLRGRDGDGTLGGRRSRGRDDADRRLLDRRSLLPTASRWPPPPSCGPPRADWPLAARTTPSVRGLIVALTVGAIPLATVRTLGPFWLVLILAVVVVAFGTAHLRPLVHRTDARVAGAAIALAGIAGVAWSLAASTNAPPSTGEPMPDSGWSVVPGQVLLWLLQSIGAFPARNEPAPRSSMPSSSWGGRSLWARRCDVRRHACEPQSCSSSRSPC